MTTTSSPRPSPPVEEREKTRAVHSSNARFSNVEALHEPTNKHAAPTELDEGLGALAAIDMALLRSF